MAERRSGRGSSSDGAGEMAEMKRWREGSGVNDGEMAEVRAPASAREAASARASALNVIQHR
ncbi:hypothetical protein Syun_012983 [Stephania yunnanensis]|uniref:Uncharacterized protein n=1 Tax=Stephania yunnanensis TaxID=152371 RepID=A0AAP0K1V6_9MAGN